jgi:hypothetical protein
LRAPNYGLSRFGAGYRRPCQHLKDQQNEHQEHENCEPSQQTSPQFSPDFALHVVILFLWPYRLKDASLNGLAAETHQIPVRATRGDRRDVGWNRDGLLRK